MSETAERLLATFDSLPPQEQHEIITAMLRRSGEFPSGVITNDALVGWADDLFQTLDGGESHGDASGPR